MIERQVFVKRRMKHWGPVLHDWIDLNASYIRAMNEEDCAYYYCEMTHVSLLSTALWRCGFVSVVEAGSSKRLHEDRRKRGLGRTDLYFYGHGIAETVEAKARGMDIKLAKLDFTNGIEAAISDVRRNITDEGDRRTAICFYAFSGDGPAGPDDWRKIEDFIGQRNPDAWALYRPAFGETQHWEDKYYYPGVLAVAEQVSP